MSVMTPKMSVKQESRHFIIFFLLFYFNINDLKNSEKWALNFANKQKVSLPELFQYETFISLVGTCDVSIILKTRMNQLNSAVFHLTRICQLWPKTILKVRGGASHRKRDLPLPLAAAGDLGEEPKTR